MRDMRVARLDRLLIVALITIAGCSGGSESPTDPVTPGKPFTLSGAVNATDTIGAKLSQPLRVVLHDDLGHRLAGVSVRFSTLYGPGVEQLTAIQTPKGITDYASSVSFTTGSDGSIEIGVKLGQLAGPAGIVIETENSTIHATDTARFTVLPGNAVSMTINAQDTLLTFGGSYTVKPIIRDRSGNIRNDPLTFRALDGSVAVTASGVVTATAYGSGGVEVSSGTAFVDTSLVTVVPVGTMAIRRGTLVKIMKLDGNVIADLTVRASATIPPLPVPAPEWTPDGQAFYSTIGDQGDLISLWKIDMTGAQTLAGSCPFTGCPTSPSAFRGPGVFLSYSPSADGRFMFLSSGGCNYSGVLYRVQIGSTAPAERLSPLDIDDCFDTIHRWPSISPDGQTLAYENDGSYFFGDWTIKFFNVAARTISPVSVAGQRPRWSPSGDRVAFVNAGSIWEVRPDGTGLRRVTTSNRQYLPGMTWSPDGRWLLGHATITGKPTIVIVEVATGFEIPLMYTNGWQDLAGEPPVGSWRPGS